MAIKTALIVGASGQDGTFLQRLLTEKRYLVYGLVRRDVQLEPGVRAIHGDVTDGQSLNYAIRVTQPDEVYNLAAQSNVGESFRLAALTTDIVATGTVRLLDALRNHCPAARMYQASTSEMFGNSPGPQNEHTAFDPRSPYACAKVAAHNAATHYRDAHGLYVACGILFNHESAIRRPSFVTRKISMAVAEMATGRTDRVVLRLGNLNARRDWGYAPEYVSAMWRMLQLPDPRDYVIATGESHSVREFAELALRVAGVQASIEGGHDMRPADVDNLVGDASLARSELGWAPATTFRDIVRIMVDADIAQMGG